MILTHKYNPVSIIDLLTNNRVEVKTSLSKPFYILLLESWGKAFIEDCSGPMVSVIDLESNKVVGKIKGKWFHVADPFKEGFILSPEEDEVHIVDLDSCQIIERIKVGDGPNRFCASSSLKKVFVTNYGDGSVSILSEIDLFSSQKLTFNLRNNFFSYPNPFNPECFIPVGRMKDEGENIIPMKVEIRIYNILGQLVREIDAPMGFGDRFGGNNISQISESVYWDGRDNQGLEVPSGIYFYEVGEKTVKKMVMLK
jgi:DNA-binding beta-propeller fold protein YncE